MRKIKLAAIIPDHKDATSMYRGAGPLSLLQKDYDLEVSYLASADMVTLLHYDVVFMQRPTGTPSLGIAKLVKDCGLPLWIDFDDYPFAVTSDNPMSGHYASKEVMDSTEALIRLADVVTVTNDTLKEYLGEYLGFIKDGKVVGETIDIRVIPNAYDERFHGPFIEPTDNKKIVWRGGLSHDRDLFQFTPMIKRVLAKHKDWTMEFVGGVPWYVKEQYDASQVTFTPVQDFLSYRKHMQLLNAAIQVVPLHDSKLSRCRSNIGWIEGTVFGSAIFGPNFYSWLGCDKSYFYNHLNDFVDNFEELIELSSDHRSYANLISESKILKNFNLKIINKQRIDIVRGLAKWDTMKKRRQ